MSFTIEQIVGNWVTTNGGGVTITPKAPGNVIYVVSGAGSGSNDSAAGALSDTAGNTITTLGSVDIQTGGDWALHGMIENCLAQTTTIALSAVQGAGTAIIAIEVSGLENAAPLASAIAAATITGSSAPYTASTPATGTISAVPALAIAFGCTPESTGPFSDGAYAGWTEGSIAWQTSPPPNNFIVQYQEITTQEAVIPQFPVSANAGYYAGIGVAVFEEIPPPSAQWLEWIAQPIGPGMNITDGARGGFTGPAAIALCGPEAPFGSIVQIFPIAAGTSGTLIVNDCASVADASAANQIFSLDYSQITANVPIQVNATFRTGLVISSVPAGMAYAVLYDGPEGPGGTVNVHAE